MGQVGQQARAEPPDCGAYAQCVGEHQPGDEHVPEQLAPTPTAESEQSQQDGCGQHAQVCRENAERLAQGAVEGGVRPSGRRKFRRDDAKRDSDKRGGARGQGDRDQVMSVATSAG